MTLFTCEKCEIQDIPPNYSIWTGLGQLTQMTRLVIGLNVSEIPTSAFRTNLGLEPANLGRITIQLQRKNSIINSGAFQSLNKLTEIIFQHSNIGLFKKEAFRFNSKPAQSTTVTTPKPTTVTTPKPITTVTTPKPTPKPTTVTTPKPVTTVTTPKTTTKKSITESAIAKLTLRFSYLNFSDNPFEAGAFTGLDRLVQIVFWRTDINHLSESVFKLVLENPLNMIFFNDPTEVEDVWSSIDCEDCGNLWLIQQNKEHQVKHARCKSNPDKKLFDEEVKSDLENNCQGNYN